MKDRPDTITAGAVIDMEEGLPEGATGVRWPNGWIECRGHLEDLSWRQGANPEDYEVVGEVQYTGTVCDTCAELN